MEQHYNDEIDLRDIIHVLWNYRRMIFALFLLTVLSSGLLSFLVLKPVYQSAAIIYPGYFSHQIYSNPTNAREILQSNGLLRQVAEEFVPSFQPEHLDSFKATISVNAVSNTPYLQITAQREQPL